MSHKTDATLRPFLFAFSHCVPSGRCVAHCSFEITLLQAIMLTLLLVCAFSPRVHSIPRGPHFSARNDKYKSITCPQGKYHCNAISLSKTISRRRHITAVRLIAPKVHRAEGASLLPEANTSHHRFYKVSLPGDCHSTAKRCFAMT